MSLSSLSFTRSPGLPTQEPTLPAPSQATAGPLQPPQHLAASRRTAQAGPSSVVPTRLRAPLPASPGACVESVRPTSPASADEDRPLTLADAVKIANETDYAQRLALASMGYEVLFKHTLKTYAAARICRCEWLESGDETHQAAAQTLSIKASLLNGLYLMRRHHKEWNLATPEISQKTLRNVLPMLHNALFLCQNESSAVRFPVEGLQDALAYLEKQAGQSLEYLKAAPAFDSEHVLACLDLLEVARRLQHVLAHGPVSGPTDPVDEKPQAATSSSPRQRSFKSVLVETPPARPEPPPVQADPASRQACAPAHNPPGLRHPPRPLAQGMETPPVRDQPTPAPKAKPRHPGTSQRGATQPTRPAARPPTRQPAATSRGPAPTQAPSPGPVPGHAVKSQAEPATPASAEAAARRQEQLASLRGALAPLRDEAHRLHDAARACATAPVTGGPPWARQSLEFAAWQSAALADDACAQALAGHAQACGLGPRDPAVQELRRKFDIASRGALEGALGAAESALVVFLQRWEAAGSQEGAKPAGPHSQADLVTLGGELQRQWRDAPLWPRMPVLGARMAVFDACEAISDVKAGSPSAPREAAELMCQATDDARHACEGAKGALGAQLRTFRAACKSQRDKLLQDVVHQEYEAADAALARSSQALKPLLDRSREIATACHGLIAGDPLPAARTAGPALQTGMPAEPADMPAADRSLVAMAGTLEASLRAQREQAFRLPADAPGQTVLEQQAVLKVRQQIELSAATAAATVTSLHELRIALAQAPLDRQPPLVRHHTKAMAARAVTLNQLMLTQEGALEKISKDPVRHLLQRSWVPLCHDLRHVQIVHRSLEVLEQLLDARVSADRACRLLAKGHSAAPGPELNGNMHQSIATWMNGEMGSLQEVLDMERFDMEADAWQAETTRLQETIDGLERRIDCDSALIQGKYFLHVLALTAPTPDAAALRELHVVDQLVRRSIQRSGELARVTKAMQTHAAASPQASEQQAQIRVNEALREQLRAKQEELLRTLAALRAQGPAPAAAAVQPEAGASSRASGRRGRRSRS